MTQLSEVVGCNLLNDLVDQKFYLDFCQRRQQVLCVIGCHATEPVALIWGDGAVHQHIARILHVHEYASGLR
jgi:hypothetical protein